MKIKKLEQKKSSLSKNSGKSNLLSDELLQKTKDIVIGTCQAGIVISRRMVIVFGTGVSLCF